MENDDSNYENSGCQITNVNKMVQSQKVNAIRIALLPHSKHVIGCHVYALIQAIYKHVPMYSNRRTLENGDQV